MRFCLIALLVFSLAGLVAAQESPSHEEIALDLIQQAKTRGWTQLDLSSLGLRELPPELWELTHLEYLNLSTEHYHDGHYWVNIPNEITELPAEIANLVALKTLDLSGNPLGSLPPEIGELRQLKSLLLASTQLSSLPPEIGQLEALCVLDLRNNNLSHLPAELRHLDLLGSTTCEGYRSGIMLDDNPLISPPQDVIEQGTPAILDYLRNEAWWHMQKLIVSGLGSLGVVTLSIVGLLWRGRRGKQKRKNKE